MYKSHSAPSYAMPAAFSPGLEVRAAERTLYVSGQLGIAIDGSSAEGIEAQTEIIMTNMMGIAASAGMSVDNLVKLTAFLIDPADTAGFVQVRGRYLGNIKPASTLLFVSQLARPELLAEVEAVFSK